MLDLTSVLKYCVEEEIITIKESKIWIFPSVWLIDSAVGVWLQKKGASEIFKKLHNFYNVTIQQLGEIFLE